MDYCDNDNFVVSKAVKVFLFINIVVHSESAGEKNMMEEIKKSIFAGFVSKKGILKYYVCVVKVEQFGVEYNSFGNFCRKFSRMGMLVQYFISIYLDAFSINIIFVCFMY